MSAQEVVELRPNDDKAAAVVEAAEVAREMSDDARLARDDDMWADIESALVESLRSLLPAIRRAVLERRERAEEFEYERAVDHHYATKEKRENDQWHEQFAKDSESRELHRRFEELEGRIANLEGTRQ